MTKFPDWWPENLYPVEVFTMTDTEFEAALPDPIMRTRLSGYYGRLFWNIASKSILQAMQTYMREVSDE